MKIMVEPEGVSGVFKEGIPLLEIIGKLGIRLDAVCNGKGVCGKCKVLVREAAGTLPPLSGFEERRLSRREVEQGYRLACMLQPRDDLTVYIPLSSRLPRQRLQTEGLRLHVALKPAFKKYSIKVSKPTIEDQRSDQDRLLDALREECNISGLEFKPYAIQRLPSSIRDASGMATVTVKHGKHIVDVEPEDNRGELYGVAVDIGTTKIAYYLLNLVTGEEVSVTSMMNPQREFGEDVMTRLTYASRSEKGKDELQERVISALNDLTRKACNESGVDPRSIYEMVAVCNTVMHHLLLKLETRYLGLSPYTQVLRTSLQQESSVLGFQINPNGYITTLPTIRSFVGADNTAVCLVTRIMEKKRPTLILDIGTNTEIDCGGGGLGVYATSTPSGPAFEGWATRCGMTAAPGAIERVFIDAETLGVMFRTIDDEPPVGICGSGFVDALSEMYKNRVLDWKSRLNKSLESERLRKGSEGYEFVLAWKDETGHGEDVVISQKDIGELIKAKAAIHAGITLLLDRLNLKVDSLDEILMAGAFGSYIDPENAKVIGLLPDVDSDRVKIIGNAAGSGAKIALLNTDEREKAEEISSKIRFIELATNPKFVKEYVDSMYIPHRDLSAYQKTLKALGIEHGKDNRD